jgi:hypothetical protein
MHELDREEGRDQNQQQVRAHKGIIVDGPVEAHGPPGLFGPGRGPRKKSQASVVLKPVKRSITLSFVLVGLLALAVAGALTQLVRGKRPVLLTA